MSDDTLGRIAFEAYSRAMNGKTYDGKPIPKWEDLSEAVREGWRQATIAVQQNMVETIRNIFA